MSIAEKDLKVTKMKKEIRTGTITSKRQLTIPKDFCDKLGLEKDVELILEEDGIVIKKLPLDENLNDDFSDLILQSILEEGYTGKENILREFRMRKRVLPMAVRKLINEAREYAGKDTRTSEELDKELFGGED
ncbi:MAG: AbrB/MazE/SpoVT family DNA-binding domain-containing protein [Clostridia bacterium]|jgi:AbrB family looped-hinge helix DNA binding protein|nr:AbrB/MazE/SpoVT family DNA-binding domain-containing protein [Clostridia bacterium]